MPAAAYFSVRANTTGIADKKVFTSRKLNAAIEDGVFQRFQPSAIWQSVVGPEPTPFVLYHFHCKHESAADPVCIQVRLLEGFGPNRDRSPQGFQGLLSFVRVTTYKSRPPDAFGSGRFELKYRALPAP